MANGIYSAVSGAVAQTRLLDTVANNLANVSTTGFKGGRINFAEVLARATNRRRPADLIFVRPAEVRMDLRPGALRPTESRMDVALEGRGFLCLKDGSQPVYSRGGRLTVRADGVLADSEGRPLLARNNRELRPGLDAGELTIDTDGTVRTEAGTVGVLKLVEFDRPAALQWAGENRVTAPAAAAARPATSTMVRQGYLEASNVSAVGEITSMIVASRAYEAVHKIISTFREMDGRAANELAQER